MVYVLTFPKRKENSFICARGAVMKFSWNRPLLSKTSHHHYLSLFRKEMHIFSKKFDKHFSSAAQRKFPCSFKIEHRGHKIAGIHGEKGKKGTSA
jgi:hypothetical protein